MTMSAKRIVLVGAFGDELFWGSSILSKLRGPASNAHGMSEPRDEAEACPETLRSAVLPRAEAHGETTEESHEEEFDEEVSGERPVASE
jgi:hypothetical protein